MIREGCDLTAELPAALLVLAPGTAYVDDVTVYPNRVAMRIRDHAGQWTLIELSGELIRGAGHVPADLERVFAVRIKVTRQPSALDCSVLGTSEDGPRRVAIDLAQALDLARSGVHTVLDVA